MSNIGAAKILTASKSQFKVLQYEILSIKLNTTYTNKAIICFDSKIMVNFINKIQVDIPINIANFYIIDIPI